LLTEALVVRLATRVVAVSSYVAETFSRYRSDIEVIENGVDVEVFKPNDTTRDRVRTQLGFGSEVVFLYAGRWARSKGVDQLVQVAHSKGLNSGSFVLLLIGESDPSESGLSDSMNNLNEGSRIRILGRVVESLPDILNAADVFVLPSLYEGMPMGFLEAMASGLPVLASDIPVNRMLVDRAGCGWTFRAGDANDLERAMLAILNEPIPRLMSVNARAAALRFHALEEECRRYLAIYSKLGVAP